MLTFKLTQTTNTQNTITVYTIHIFSKNTIPHFQRSEFNITLLIIKTNKFFQKV